MQAVQCSLPDFDNGQWELRKDVPVFTDDKGEHGLEKLAHICKVNNARETNTCDLSPLSLGHTRPDAPETDQPPIIGYARNYRLATFGKYPAIIADLYIEKDKSHFLKQFPRRSIELGTQLWNDGVIDPIALLSTSTPKKDLGLLFSRAKYSMADSKKVTSTKIVKRGDEYIVQAFVNGVRYPEADYFTDDKTDAEQTAKLMVSASEKNQENKDDKSTYSETGDQLNEQELIQKVLQVLAETPEFKFLQDQMKAAQAPEEPVAANEEPKPEEPVIKNEEPKPEDKPEEKEANEEEKPEDKLQHRRELVTLKQENANIKAALQEVTRKFRRADREKDLVKLESEGLIFEHNEELNFVTDLEDKAYANHLGRMKKLYQKAPVGVRLQPASVNDFGGEKSLTKEGLDNIINAFSGKKISAEEALTRLNKK